MVDSLNCGTVIEKVVGSFLSGCFYLGMLTIHMLPACNDASNDTGNAVETTISSAEGKIDFDSHHIVKERKNIK